MMSSEENRFELIKNMDETSAADVPSSNDEQGSNDDSPQDFSMTNTLVAAYGAVRINDQTDRLDADDLAAGWADIEHKVPELHATVRVGAKTDLGRIRENNEDKFDMLEPTDEGFLASKGRFYGVADGMGGHSAGQIASELALKTVLQRYYRDPSSHIVESLRQSIEEANTLVYETAQLIPERQGMGTTLTVLIIREDRATIAHVGDSRAYLIRGGEARQLTHDHSLVAEQVRMGAITAEDAATSPLRNIILRSIGTGPSVVADFYEELLVAGDLLVLCSDGLTGHVTAEEIVETVATPAARRRGPSMGAYRLVELANARGGRDNISVVIIEVESITEYVAEGDPAQSSLDHTLFESHMTFDHSGAVEGPTI